MSFFVLVGLYFIINGSLPIKLKIRNVNDVTTAQIHKKSLMPPFNDIDITVPNVKLAVVTTSRGSKGSTTYRVELEAYNGQRYPITNYYSSGYSSKAKLQDKINSMIQNKSDFDYIVRQYFMIYFGLIFTLIPSIMIFSLISKGSSTSTLKKDETISSIETTPTKKVEPEEEKYKDINNSIIK